MNEEKHFNQYIKILELEPASPTYSFLEKIVSAHLAKIPFENISKLLYKKNGMTDIPDFEQYLDGIEKYNFGGTCYSINYYLYLLLKYLGFDVKLCGADMRNPDVHIISIVNVNEKEFIVDCGYAAPFLEPLPRNLSIDYIITFGDEKYILRPKSSNGTSKLEQYYKDELKHFYIAKPEPILQQEFQKVIGDSYDAAALFMNALLITRFSRNYSAVFRNFYLTEVKGSEITRKVIAKDEIPGVVKKIFGMPVHLVKEAISDLSSLKDIYS